MPGSQFAVSSNNLSATYVAHGMMRGPQRERSARAGTADRLCTRQYGGPRSGGATRSLTPRGVSGRLDFPRYYLRGTHCSPRLGGLLTGLGSRRYPGGLAVGSPWAIHDASWDSPRKT